MSGLFRAPKRSRRGAGRKSSWSLLGIFRGLICDVRACEGHENPALGQFEPDHLFRTGAGPPCPKQTFCSALSVGIVLGHQDILPAKS